MNDSRIINAALLAGLAGHLAGLEEHQRQADENPNRSPSHILDNRIADIRFALEDEGRHPDQVIEDALSMDHITPGARSVLEGEKNRRADAKASAEIRAQAMQAASRHDEAAEEAENNHDEELAYWHREGARAARETAERHS